MQELPTIRCRHIREKDLKKIMEWRMQPDITRYMNTDPRLTLASQKEWFASIRDIKPFFYWMITVGGQDVGLIQIVEYSKDECEWGYFVAVKSARSLALAVSLELSLYDFIFTHTRVKTIYAKTFSTNASVVRLHELCGCDTIEVLTDHVHKNGESFDVTVQAMPLDKWQKIKTTHQYQPVEFESERT
jgi:hypothetical protein